MTIDELRTLAAQSRTAGRTVERLTSDHEWSPGHTIDALAVDTRALANAVALKLDEVNTAAALADCLWSVLTIADELGIDLEAAFVARHDEVLAQLEHIRLAQLTAEYTN